MLNEKSHLRQVWDIKSVLLVNIPTHHHYYDVNDVNHEKSNGIKDSDFLSPENVKCPKTRHDVETDISQKWSLHQFERMCDRNSTSENNNLKSKLNKPNSLEVAI